MTAERRGDKRTRRCGTCIYTGLCGLALLALGWATVLHHAVPAATAAFSLGGAALLVAPFVSRVEGKLRFGPVEMTLRQKVIEAAKSADEGSLEGVLPLLTSDDIEVARVQVPGRFVGRRLVDPELAFLRKRLNVSVLGIREARDHPWRAGGAISELPLPETAELLVAGHRDTIAYLRLLIASDDEELWRRVT